MIERQQIDGKMWAVQYLTSKREPTTKEAAERIYMVADDGETKSLIVNPANKVRKYNPYRADDGKMTTKIKARMVVPTEEDQEKGEPILHRSESEDGKSRSKLVTGGGKKKKKPSGSGIRSYG